MTDYPLTWLADVLRDAGCRVIEESGWKTRGRPASSGTFKPRALLRHWDASPPGSHSTSTIINGNTSAPGPLCCIWTCDGDSSHPPSVHVIAAGRCNHGGTGAGWGVIPQDDANTYAVGHEIRQTVDKPWPADQLEQVQRAEAAILKRLGATTNNALCSHSEYAPDRKIDTTEGSHGQDMGDERAAVQAIINGDEGGDDLKNNYLALTCDGMGAVATSGAFVYWDGEQSDSAGIHPEGQGGTTCPFDCTMSGVLEVHVDSGVIDAEIDRYVGDDYVSRCGRAVSLGAGYANVPFVGAFNKGDKLYARVKAHSGGGVVDYARLTLTQLERT